MREGALRIHSAFRALRNILLFNDFQRRKFSSATLSEDFAELLAWRLPDDPFHLQVK